jgi:hypothetical protein
MPADARARCLRAAATIAGMSAILLIPTLLNGFPFLFWDTGTYLRAAIVMGVPDDRPIFYSLFLLPLHMQLTLWPIAMVQAVITALFLKAAGTAMFGVRGNLFFIALSLFLTLVTGLPWFAGLLIPDIFTAMLVLGFLLTAFAWERCARGQRVVLFISLTLFISFHYSHLPLTLAALVILGLLALLGWRPSGKLWPRFAVIAGAGALAATAFLLSNFAAFGTLSLSQGSNAFLLGRLLDEGIGMEILYEECPARGWKICAEIADLEQHIAWNEAQADPTLNPLSNYFIWQGPLQRMGWFRDYNAEASEIIAEGLARAPGRIFLHALKNSFVQMADFHVGDAVAKLPPDVYVLDVLDEFFGPDMRADAAASLQMRGELPFGPMNVVFDVVVMLSLVPLLMALAFGHRRDREMFYLVLALLLFLAANATATSALSGVYERYQARLIWMVPMFAALLLWRWRGLMPRMPSQLRP